MIINIITNWLFLKICKPLSYPLLHWIRKFEMKLILLFPFHTWGNSGLDLKNSPTDLEGWKRKVLWFQLWFIPSNLKFLTIYCCLWMVDGYSRRWFWILLFILFFFKLLFILIATLCNWLSFWCFRCRSGMFYSKNVNKIY